MTSRGRGARIKGASFERSLANLLSKETSYEFKSGLGKTRCGATERPDVYSEELPMLHIEAKRHKKVIIKRALQQAIEDARPGALPIAITKDDREDTLVTMRFDDWLPFLNAYLDTL